MKQILMVLLALGAAPFAHADKYFEVYGPCYYEYDRTTGIYKIVSDNAPSIFISNVSGEMMMDYINEYC